jgi:hypothetical protein
MDRDTSFFGYVNRLGEYIIPLSFLLADEFHERRAFAMNSSGLHLFDERGGTVAVFDKNLVGGEFHEGISIISRIEDETDGNTKVDGFIDKGGEFIIPPSLRNRVDTASIHQPEDHCSGGLIRLKEEDAYGYIDRTGAFVISPRYCWGSRFCLGLAAVSEGNKFGYIDKTASVRIPFVFEDANPFSEGLAAVRIQDTYGYIDVQGKIIIEPRFEGAGDFVNGMAQIRWQGKAGIIDKEGRSVLPPVFDSLGIFEEGLCRFVIEGRNGLIDRKGNTLINDMIETPELFLRMSDARLN